MQIFFSPSSNPCHFSLSAYYLRLDKNKCTNYIPACSYSWVALFQSALHLVRLSFVLRKWAVKTINNLREVKRCGHDQHQNNDCLCFMSTRTKNKMLLVVLANHGKQNIHTHTTSNHLNDFALCQLCGNSKWKLLWAQCFLWCKK